MSSQPHPRRARQTEQGYVLLTLLLMIAVMGIVAATMITSLKFDIKRDREEEMIHRGVQYSRAIRAYYKKFGRYPVTIENLENTNQQRFLRRRYKDPLTGKDFRLLHFGEAKLSLNGLGGGAIPGANTVGPNGALTSSGQSNSSFGNNSAFGSSSTLGQSRQVTQTSGADAPQTGDSGTDAGAAQTASGSSDAGDQGSGDHSEQTFGGMPIVGVASTSKQPTIREFDRKKKYNEWQFVYDPTSDRGMLITEPYQPQLQMFGTGPQNVNGPGQNSTPGLGTAAPGAAAPGAAGNPGASGNPPGDPNQPTDTPVQQ
jgi:type II secretory pathway pseudopilin PulG